MKITVKSSTLVKPAKETPRCILWNSNVDLVIPRIHIPTVYFYNAKCNDASAFNCVHLKEALGRALVPFYPMAGRLKDKGRGRIDINCNGEGVLFVEADADGLMSEYGEYFAPCMRMRQLIPQVDYSEEGTSFPLLVIQVTVFKCGGVAIGTGVHHHVADGLAALWFLNYWSDVVRGVEKPANPFFDRTLLRARDPPIPKFSHVEYQPPPPLLSTEDGYRRQENGVSNKMGDNHVIQSDDLSKVNGDLMETNGHCIDVESYHLKLTSTNVQVNANDGSLSRENGEYCNGITVDHSKKQSSIQLDHDDCRKANGDCQYSATSAISQNGSHVKQNNPVHASICKDDEFVQPLDEKVRAAVEETPNTEYYGPISAELFIFSHEQVESLKARAAEHAEPGERPFSSYEILAAHTWRCVCLARGLQDAQATKLYIATDGRGRIQPSLPIDYFGNVIFTAAPVMEVWQLVREPLAAAARHIRQTVQVMDNEYLRSALDFLELQPNLAEFSRGAHTFKTPNLGITSWVRLPIYGADFGWGPPLSMAPAGVPFEGLAYLLPGPPSDKRLRLSITLSPDHMLRFKELIYDR